MNNICDFRVRRFYEERRQRKNVYTKKNAMQHTYNVRCVQYVRGICACLRNRLRVNQFTSKWTKAEKCRFKENMRRIT